MSTRLMVLGLLHAAPMHGYDIRKRLDIIHAEAWADVLPGSIYHALKQMEKEGLLAVEATERSGNRLRAVYALTDAGRRAYRDELRRAPGRCRRARFRPACTPPSPSSTTCPDRRRPR